MLDNKEYQMIEIPEELSDVVNRAIFEGKSQRQEKKGRSVRQNRNRWGYRGMGIAAAALFGSMILLLNTSSAFAQAVSEIPIIGNLCRIVTFREYRVEDEIRYIDAKIPQMESSLASEESGDNGIKELEERVNLEIQKKIAERIALNEEVAREYYDAFIATGGKPEDFIPVGITVDYEIKCINPQHVSFVIYQYETAFHAYNQEIYYNIDMENGRILTLKDWFGEDYRQIVADSIEKTLEGWTQEQKECLWEDLSFAEVVNENTDFYLNEDGCVVVVFPKYEVAIGAAGAMEFVIETEGVNGGIQ